MLYLYKQQDTELITDSVIDYIPSALEIYIDNQLVGTYTNESLDVNYFIFNIPSGSIEQFSNSDHTLKYEYYEEIIKSELCTIKDLTIKETPTTVTKIKSIKYYESK